MKTGLLFVLVCAQGCRLIGAGIGSQIKSERTERTGFDETQVVPTADLVLGTDYEFRFAKGSVLQGRVFGENRFLTTEGLYVEASMDSVVSVHPATYGTVERRATLIGLFVGLAVDLVWVVATKPWNAPI